MKTYKKILIILVITLCIMNKAVYSTTIDYYEGEIALNKIKVMLIIIVPLVAILVILLFISRWKKLMNKKYIKIGIIILSIIIGINCTRLILFYNLHKEQIQYYKNYNIPDGWIG